jgi:hypothetical protein
MRAGEPVARFNDVTSAEAVYIDFVSEEMEPFEKESEEIESIKLAIVTKYLFRRFENLPRVYRNSSHGGYGR